MPIRSHVPQNTQGQLVRLIKIGQLLTKQLNRSIAKYGLTFNQVHILFVIHYTQKEGIQTMSMRRLSQILVVSLPNTTGLVDRLQQEGYMTKETSKKDHRIHCLALTKKGRNFITRLRKGWPPKEMRAIDQFFRTLPPQQREHFTTTLDELGTYLRDECRKV